MMELLERILRGAERRSAPPEVYGRGTWGWAPSIRRSLSTAGKSVTASSALEVIPVWSAVNLLAGAIGSLPLKVYRDGDQRAEARESRQWRLLHDRPNGEMAADEFWEFIATSLLLWGNAFIWKKRGQGDVLTELWPISPDRVGVGRQMMSDGSTVKVFWIDGQKAAFEQDILHIRGLGTDPNVGLSPVQLARQALGNQMAREEFEGAFWKNGAFFSAALQHPNTLSEQAQTRLKNQISSMSGSGQAGQVFVFEEGMTYQTMTMPLEDAQFVEQSKMTDLRVAQLFRLPPYMLGAETANSMTYSNTEMESLDFLKWSLRRWLVRVEGAVNRDAAIFPKRGLFSEFSVDALLRGSTKERYDAYAVGLTNHFLEVNEVRKDENRPPVEETEAAEEPEPVDPNADLRARVAGVRRRLGRAA